MLPKPHRLSGRMVARVYSKGQFDRLPGSTIKYLTNRSNILRLVVIVPKKIDNRAVVRNRLRRQVIEGLKTTILNSQKSLDVAILINKKEVASEIILGIDRWLKR